VKIEPSRIYDTQQLVPPSAWARAQQMFKDRWRLSMAVRHAWDIPSLPLATDTVPETYRMLGWRQNWGNVVEVIPLERAALLDVVVVPIALKLQAAGSAFDDQRAAINADKLLANAVGEMVAGIRERVQRSGTESIRINPTRLAEGQLHMILIRKWKDQGGKCALCGGDIELESDNNLLKCSPDRIDSSIPWYNFANLQITHRACNWAKNDASAELFEEWLDVVRGSSPTPKLETI
jgi:hypothetical protein